MIDNQMFHITKNGAEKCTAKKRACPLGGAHFFEKEEAEKYFHDTMIAEIGKFGDAALKKATVKANEPHYESSYERFLREELSKEVYSDDDLRDYTWDEIDADARIDRLIKRGGLVNISPGEYVLTDDLITEEAANSYYKDSYDAMLDAAQTLPEGLSLSTVIKRADPMKYKEIQSEFIDDDEDESLSYEELDEMTDDYINATMNFEDTGMSGSRAIQVTDKSVYERGLEAFKTDKIESGYPFKCISTSDGDKFIDVDDVYDDVALEEKVMNMDEFE